jgi:hypothetical protein
MTIKDDVSSYIEGRDLLATMKVEYEQACEPIKKMMEGLETKFLQYMQETGVESIRTKSGTVYTQVRTSATVADWPTVLNFIRSGEHWHMMEHRVSKLAVEAYIEEHGDVPPGVNVSRSNVVNFRRS